MAWFPPATPATTLRPRPEERSYLPFYDGILHSSANALLEYWSDEPNLDEPQSGRVYGRDAFVQWVERTREWLLRTDAEIRPVYLLSSATRVIEEVALDLTLDGERRELPVAVVSEYDDEGLTAVRVYHSMWPLTGGHEVREPLLFRDDHIDVPDVVGDYQRALAAGDLDGILACYQEDGVFREPAGGPYVFAGQEAVRHIYELQFADGAGIPLEHCTLTDDGVACALEYTAAWWGRTPIEPQAGVAVYQRGRDGKIAISRIYDDIAPPEASDSSLRPAPEEHQ